MNSRLIAAAVTVFCFFCMAQDEVRADWWEVSHQCQILDVPSEPLYKVYFSTIPPNDFDDYGDAALIELGGLWKLRYFRDVLWGDMDSRLDFQSVLPLGDTALSLPDQLVAFYLDAGWTRRMVGGRAWQIRARPGLYSDLTNPAANDFFVPLSGAYIRTFNPSMSGILGVEIRPGFERTLMPIMGIECELGGAARVEARVPKSRIEYFLSSRWTTHLGLEWRNRSFRVHEDVAGDPDLITLEDFLAWWGLTYRVSDEIHVFADFGRAFGRSIEFSGQASGADDRVNIGSGAFGRVALGGPF